MSTKRNATAILLVVTLCSFLAVVTHAQSSAQYSRDRSSAELKEFLSHNTLTSDSTSTKQQSLVEKYKRQLTPQNLIFQSSDGMARHYRINETTVLATIVASSSGRVYKSDAAATPTKLSGGLLRIQNQSTTGCTYGYRGWAKFNISSVNDASTITDVNQYVYSSALVEGAFDYLNYDVYRLDADPSTSSATSLWSDIGGGSLYENDELVSNPSNWEWSDLNNPADAELQNALVQDWFGLGYIVECTENDPTYYAEFQGYDAAASFRPYLAITYIMVPPDPPVLVFPPNNADSPSTLTFQWQPSLGADSYRLQVARDNGFTDLAHNGGGIISTSKLVQLPPTPPTKYYYWRVNATNDAGTSAYSNPYRIVNIVSHIEAIVGMVPEEFWLSQNYPNPFNPTSTIEFALPRQSQTTLVIYDILGREVERLVDEQLHAGVFKVKWDGSGSASGMYYCRMVAIPNDGGEAFVQLRKLILTK